MIVGVIAFSRVPIWRNSGLRIGSIPMTACSITVSPPSLPLPVLMDKLCLAWYVTMDSCNIEKHKSEKRSADAEGHTNPSAKLQQPIKLSKQDSSNTSRKTPNSFKSIIKVSES